MSNLLRSRRAIVMGAALVGILTACGSPGSPNATEHNDADVSFATQMIPHHAQAVEMADLVEGKAVSQEVANLAVEIQAAQAPEIQTMTGWLEEWGEAVPDSHSMGGHAMGADDGSESGEMAGMMSESEMTDLAEAEGAAFQTMWLEMMIQHHQGAIEMAQVEQEEGEFKAARDLAGAIEETQAQEINVMERLIDG